ncbi:hypothetical protein A8C56_02930 [Niabella ginsenosidivorans]|uniref:Uncharacterized protein n=1 Tax=Niabella ginsenosidivorans TaxID=1176587 RepID=A0A1A9HYB3_9BACT|nr:hypothetical protein [Niabella ginsenosidivorans]ANH80075.1 hypothetical protein A8C56_02930 [Niabella ginsenosidivorans]
MKNVNIELYHKLIEWANKIERIDHNDYQTGIRLLLGSIYCIAEAILAGTNSDITPAEGLYQIQEIVGIIKNRLDTEDFCFVEYITSVVRQLEPAA